MRFFWSILLASILPVSSAAEALFLKPQENRSLFQRSSLPLETHRLRELSADLAVLASQTVSKKDTANHRALSQLLVLSLQLDPINQAARETLQRLEKGIPVAAPDTVRYQDSFVRVQNTLSWLLDDRHEKAGLPLALLILDPLSILHPRLKAVQAVDLAGEAKRWEGVVPPLTAFRSSLSVRPTKIIANPNEVEGSTSAAAVPSLGKSSLATPLVSRSNLGPRNYSLSTVYLEAKKSIDESRVFDLVFKPKLPKSVVPELEDRVIEVLQKLHGGLPLGFFATVNMKLASYAEQNELALSGPVALLADAALSHTKLHSDLIFLAEVSSDGSLVSPDLIWDHFRYCEALQKSTNSRILIPTEAEPQLRAFLMTLASNDAYQLQIYGVDSLEEAKTLATASDKESGNKDRVAELHAEFLKTSLYEDERRFQKSKKSRRLLEQILEIEPNYLVAKIVLGQFDSTDSYVIDQKTLWMEFTACLALLEPLVEGQVRIDRGAVLKTKQELAARLMPLRSAIPTQYEHIFENIFSLVGLAERSILIRRSDLRSIDEFSSRRNASRLRAEFFSLRRSVEMLNR